MSRATCRVRKLSAWALLAAGSAQAGLLEGEPFVSYKLTRDSNLFRFEDRAEAVEANGDPELADTLQRYAAGLALQYSFGLQRLSAGGEAYQVRHQRFDRLDYEGHELRGRFEWQLGHVANGVLGLQQERRLESFADRDDQQLSLQDETRLEAAASLSVTPRWALQTRLDMRRLRSSAEPSQNYDLDESTVSLGGLYLGAVGTAGALVEAVHGSYPQREAAPGVTDRYDQYSFKLTGSWKPSGLSTLIADAGATRRDGAGGDSGDFSGFTGRLAYLRRWSGKTQLRAEAFRRVVSVEEVDANFVAQNGAVLAFDWQMATKLGVFGSVEYRRDDYEGSPALDEGGDARRDELQRAELGLEYRPLLWLAISPSAIYEERDSSRARRSYDGTLLSLEVEARYD